MVKDSEKNSNHYFVGTMIEEKFGKYGLSCKVGAYCNFNMNQVSNQNHYHSCYELCIVISGTGEFLYDGVAVNCEEGDIFMADPMVLHEVRSFEQSGMKLIYFFINIINNDDKSLCKSKEDKMIERFLKKHQNYLKKCNHLMAYLEFVDNYRGHRFGAEYGVYQAFKNLILESIAILADDSFISVSTNIASQSILEFALDYIDQNLNNRITVKEVAKHCSTTPRNLELIFNKHMNKTVKHYINEKKIALSAHYLTMLFSVHETAEMIGINDISQFSRLFKKYKNISPKKYQQLYAVKGREFGRRLVP